MEIETIALFIDVARIGSFADVARRADIDPSLVSRRISSLEKELGFRLFQRTTRTITLTEAGTEYLRRVETHVAAIADARTFGRDLVEQPTGLLRITASSSFGYEVLTPVLPGFRELYPNLHLDLLLTDRRVHLVEEGIDLAIRLGRLHDSQLIARKLMPIEFRLYASPEYLEKQGKVSHPREMEDRECLLYPGGSYSGKVSLSAPGRKRIDLELSGTVSISNALSMKQCAIYGMAPALLPNWIVSSEVEDRRLIDLFPHYTYRSDDPDPAAWMVYPSRQYLPAKVHQFMEYIGREVLQT